MKSLHKSIDFNILLSINACYSLSIYCKLGYFSVDKIWHFVPKWGGFILVCLILALWFQVWLILL